MNIIVVGSFRYEMYAKAVYDELVSQGYDTRAFDWDQYKIKGNKLFNFISQIQERLLVGPFINRANRQLLKLVKKEKASLVFIYRGTHIKAKTVGAIKDMGSVVFSYHNDDPFCGVPSKRYIRNYIESAYLCDFNFVYRHKNIGDFANINISNVEVLRSYFIKENNFHIEGKKKYDIIFVGHFEKDGRDKYIKALKDAGINIVIFGNDGWKKSLLYEELRHIIKKGKHGVEYNMLLNQTKIALVFFSKINNDTYTRRCFEIPATKTMMLCEHTYDMASMFESDKEAVYFNSENELVEKCKFLLENTSKINDIGNNGYERLMQDGHSIKNRIDTILTKFNKISNE